MQDLRRNYERGQLVEDQIPQNPFDLFTQWFEDASSAEGILEPNAMSLSTVTSEGSPDSRIVLLKDLRNEAFVFYTNYTSNKGQQLNANPACTLLFPWVNIERQVIVRGKATKVSEEESTAYFNSRPQSSRIGAWASSQSSVIQSRAELEEQLLSYTEKYADNEPPKPPHWGGYGIVPYQIEFWQGRPNRLHDRILYTRESYGWSITRLQP